MSMKRPESYHERCDKACNNCRLMWGLGACVTLCLKPLLDANVIDGNPNDFTNGEEDNPDVKRLDKTIRRWFDSNPDIVVCFTDGVCDDHVDE